MMMMTTTSASSPFKTPVVWLFLALFLSSCNVSFAASVKDEDTWGKAGNVRGKPETSEQRETIQWSNNDVVATNSKKGRELESSELQVEDEVLQLEDGEVQLEAGVTLEAEFSFLKDELSSSSSTSEPIGYVYSMSMTFRFPEDINPPTDYDIQRKMRVTTGFYIRTFASLYATSFYMASTALISFSSTSRSITVMFDLTVQFLVGGSDLFGGVVSSYGRVTNDILNADYDAYIVLLGSTVPIFATAASLDLSVMNTPAPTPVPAPTTASPTTAAPVTASPTTAAPITAPPTTAAPVSTPSPTTGAPTRSGCFRYNIFTLASDRVDGVTFSATDFGAISNVPFYDVATQQQLGRIQFTQHNMPPGVEGGQACILTNGIFGFDGTNNQLSYSFTTCNGRGTGDMITGGGGDFVGAYGTNTVVSIAPGFSRFDFNLEFCVPLS